MKTPSESQDFNKILSDIKSVKIQGAENVCKFGIQAYLLRPNKKAAKEILSIRPTEPLLQNAIKFLQKTESPSSASRKFLSNLKTAHTKTIKSGSKLIKNGMNIYSHCHSSTVIDILKYAHKTQKKSFVVYTTEVEPLLQGRMTAKDLAKSGIKTIIAPDLAAEQLLARCDLFLFGADAFTSSEVANKIGTSTLVKLAKLHGVPRYSCGIALKFAKKIKIEKRSAKEVWDEREKNIQPINPAFDRTKIKELSGIVSEFGVLPSREFVKKAKAKLKEL